jgi:hypothetical protein
MERPGPAAGNGQGWRSKSHAGLFAEAGAGPTARFFQASVLPCPHPAEADIRALEGQAGFGPTSVIGCASQHSRQSGFRRVPLPVSTASDVGDLLNHLVCDGEQRWRDVERLGGLQVDHELELGRLLDGQVGRLDAFENVAGVDANLTKTARDVGSVAHQPAGRDH